MCRTQEGVPLYLYLGNRRGLIWKALVWKHQVAELAVRHATERKNNTLALPDGASPTDLRFLGTKSKKKSEA